MVGTGGLPISEFVKQRDTNDAGPGVYALALGKGFSVLQKTDDRQLFWVGHVARVHEHYARRPASA